MMFLDVFSSPNLRRKIFISPDTAGLPFVQLSARVQNDGPRMLAQRLPERDNQPRIIDGPENVRNISDFCRCFVVMFDRSDHPSVPTSAFMFLSSVGAPFLRPGLQSHRAPVAAAVKGSAQPRGATRSRLFAASMASKASTGP